MTDDTRPSPPPTPPPPPASPTPVAEPTPARPPLLRRVAHRLNPGTWPPIAWIARKIRDTRSFRRPLFWWITGTAVFLGINGLAYVLIDTWETEVHDLNHLSAVHGDAIGNENAIVAEQSARISLLTDQTTAADTRLTDLGTDADAEKSLSDDYKAAAKGFQKCADERASAIVRAWSGRSVASVVSTAKIECAAAQKILDKAKEAN